MAPSEISRLAINFRAELPEAELNALPHPATALLQREWMWAQLAAHWRLYRSGYHLHARASWRRAHPKRRQQQRTTSPSDLHLLLAQRVIRSEEDRMSAEDWRALGQIKEQMQEATEVTRAQAAEAAGNCREAPLQPFPQAASQSASHAASRATSQSASRMAAREFEQAQELESRLLAARTQQIGLEAEDALVRLLASDDAQAQAFQHGQIEALGEAVAPPGSSIEERLLAAVIAKARFEALLWSALADTLLQRPAAHVQPNQRVKRAAKIGIISDERAQALLAQQARFAEKRYLLALRELANLRRLDGPLPQGSLVSPETASVAPSLS